MNAEEAKKTEADLIAKFEGWAAEEQRKNPRLSASQAWERALNSHPRSYARYLESREWRVPANRW